MGLLDEKAEDLKHTDLLKLRDFMNAREVNRNK
jgi:hypothetical protein